MSNISEKVPYNVRYITTLDDGRRFDSPFTTFDHTVKNVIRPPTLKRIRPVDFFLDGTTREVTSVIRDKSSVRLGKQMSGYYQEYYGDSGHRYFDLTATPVIGADFAPLLNKARRQVRGDAINLAQAFAEYRQTCKLYADLTRKILPYVKAVVTRSLKPLLQHPQKYRRMDQTLPALGRRAAKQASSAHLQFVYGVQPHLSDLDGAMRAFIIKAQKPLFISGRVSSRRSASKSNIAETLMYSENMLARAQLDLETLIVERVSYRAEFDGNPIGSTLATYGFSNPLALLYELTPFSFVLDWWVNVGETLQSLDSCLLVKDFKTRSSYRRRDSCFMTPINHEVFKGSASEIRVTTYRPETVSTSLIASLQYKPSVSLTHVTNGISLLTQLLVGRKHHR